MTEFDVKSRSFLENNVIFVNIVKGTMLLLSAWRLSRLGLVVCLSISILSIFIIQSKYNGDM